MQELFIAVRARKRYYYTYNEGILSVERVSRKPNCLKERYMKVAYLGRKGTFSEISVLDFYRGQDAEAVSFPSFASMFSALENGDVDRAMFPVENTTTGLITRAYDLFQYHSVYAVGEVNVPVRDNLICLPGAVLSDIKEVYSHPEALLQCSRFLSENPQIKTVLFTDTASSVEHIKKLGDPSKAAIAALRAAEVYDLPVLMKNIQNNDSNMTRFLCVSASPDYPDNANKVSIMLTLKHDPGSLCHALAIFSAKNLNVLHLESRPIPGKVFEYCFYIDFTGDLKDPDVAEVIRRLEYDSLDLRIFGNYKAAR